MSTTSDTATSPTESETRDPWIMRAATSRPLSSVRGRKAGRQVDAGGAEGDRRHQRPAARLRGERLPGAPRAAREGGEAQPPLRDRGEGAVAGEKGGEDGDRRERGDEHEPRESEAVGGEA